MTPEYHCACCEAAPVPEDDANARIAELEAELADALPAVRAEQRKTARAEARLAAVIAHLNDLFGYLDWYDATPASKLRAGNVRALAHKARAAATGGAE